MPARRDRTLQILPIGSHPTIGSSCQAARHRYQRLQPSPFASHRRSRSKRRRNTARLTGVSTSPQSSSLKMTRRRSTETALTFRRSAIGKMSAVLVMPRRARSTPDSGKIAVVQRADVDGRKRHCNRAPVAGVGRVPSRIGITESYLATRLTLCRR